MAFRLLDMARFTVSKALALAAAAALIGLAPAGAAEPKLLVYDNDFFSPANADILPLIGDPDVKVLGFTVVTGDGWLDEETAFLLRSLEIAGRTDIPVVKGALYPLVNTPARTRAWEQAYGRIPWKGAFNPATADHGFHPDDPFLIGPDPAGSPTIKATPGLAADFLIEQVHRHPHQVTILAAGPLTNIALAIRLDPQFSSLAKELVLMGGMVDINLPQVTGNTNYNTDFNFIFDPEAAHIALTAPWAKVTVVGNISNDTLMTPQLMAQIAAKKTPMTELMAKTIDGLPLWDQLAAAIAADPGIVSKTVSAYMDVDTTWGPFYGVTRLWPEGYQPHQGEQKVDVVMAIDTPRFIQAFVKAAQTPVGGKR